MTLSEYYDALARHDWTYEYSDDNGVFKRGYAERNRLEREWKTSRDHWALYHAYKNYVFHGEAKPERPTGVAVAPA